MKKEVTIFCPLFSPPFYARATLRRGKIWLLWPVDPTAQRGTSKETRRLQRDAPHFCPSIRFGAAVLQLSVLTRSHPSSLIRTTVSTWTLNQSTGHALGTNTVAMTWCGDLKGILLEAILSERVSMKAE